MFCCLCRSYGRVANVHIPNEPLTRCHKGYAFAATSGPVIRYIEISNTYENEASQTITPCLIYPQFSQFCMSLGRWNDVCTIYLWQLWPYDPLVTGYVERTGFRQGDDDNLFGSAGVTGWTPCCPLLLGGIFCQNQKRMNLSTDLGDKKWWLEVRVLECRCA